MAIRWNIIDFRAAGDIRELPDIRRGHLWPSTVISQYDNSPRLCALLAGLEGQIDPFWDIQEFLTEVFDPRTATGWGLDCWGQIVGISRDIQLAGTNTAFGFDGSGLEPFDQAPFWSSDATSYYRLTDEAYRQLIFLKAAINISDGTLASLNRIMHTMYGSRGTVCVIHVGTMRIRFFFDFYLQPFERALIARDDVPPKPAGVGFDLYEVNRAETFGFDGSGLQPFDQGNFAPGGPQDAYSL